MTNRIELNWKLDGFIDEQRYYCSETPIDLENLSLPKAVLAGDVRTYVDTEIEIGKTYHVCVGSVKNGVEKISDVSVVFAGGDIYWTSVASLMHFNNNFIDQKAKIWTIVGSPSFISNSAFKTAVHFNNTSKYINTDAADFFDFSGSFTCEFFAEIFAKPSKSGISAIVNIGVPDTITLYSGFGVNSAGFPHFYEYNNNNGVTLTGASAIQLNTEKHFALCYNKSDNRLSIFIDGSLVASRAIPVITRPASQRFAMSSGYSEYMTNCAVREFRYTKGVCRYTENFEIPTTPLPDM